MTEKRELKRQLKAIIQKAHRALASAKTHLEQKDCDFASSKAYYAVFYMMEAVLITKGLSFSKHSAVIAAFNRHFVKQGIFPKQFSKNTKKLMKDREIGDYSYELTISKEEAEKDIACAENIVETIVEYLESFMKVK